MLGEYPRWLFSRFLLSWTEQKWHSLIYPFKFRRVFSRFFCRSCAKQAQNGYDHKISVKKKTKKKKSCFVLYLWNLSVTTWWNERMIVNLNIRFYISYIGKNHRTPSHRRLFFEFEQGKLYWVMIEKNHAFCASTQMPS
jgi:hypothetical protein